VRREILPEGMDVGDETSSSGSSPAFGTKLGLRGKKRGRVLVII